MSFTYSRLAKSRKEMTANHTQVIEEMQVDFAKELMQREVKLEQYDVAMQEKEATIEKLKKK